MTIRWHIAVLALALATASCDRYQPPPPPRPSTEALALWNAIPANEKSRHRLVFLPGRYFVMVAQEFRSVAVPQDWGYHLAVEEIAPSSDPSYDALANWQAVQNLDFTRSTDECGNPSAKPTKEL